MPNLEILSSKIPYRTKNLQETALGLLQVEHAPAIRFPTLFPHSSSLVLVELPDELDSSSFFSFSSSLKHTLHQASADDL